MESLTVLLLCLVVVSCAFPQDGRRATRQTIRPSVVQPQLIQRGSYVQPQLFNTYSPPRKIATVHHYAHSPCISGFEPDTHIVHHTGDSSVTVSPHTEHHVYNPSSVSSSQVISSLTAQKTLVPPGQAVTLRRSQDLNDDGSFSYGYQTDNGISVETIASPPRVISPEETIQTVRGSYSYTAPDGTPITTYWIADENGFRAEGDHIPKEPISTN